MHLYLLTAVLFTWTFIFGCITASAQSTTEASSEIATSLITLKKLRAARLEARFRSRRLIVNNDGNDKAKSPHTIEDFLVSRTAGLANTHVESIFYCSGVPMLYTHRSKIAEQMGVGNHTDVPGKEWVDSFNKEDTDSLEIVVDWCKRNNREVFWSMRMNDRHDSSRNWKYLITDWKRSHPELLMGTEKEGLPDHFERGHRSWSLMRYDKPEVRDKMFDIVQEICQEYDIDGIELDFWRHPGFFVEPLMGQPVPRKKRRMMTSLIRRIRRMTEEVGMKRGRPILVAIRIPDSMDYCRAMGLDVERWLEDDLIDLVIGAGYFKLEPWENLVATGKKYNVPVYACLAIRRIQPEKNPVGKADIKVWRGEAHNAWQAGVDGIYLFNRFDPHDPLLNELGDPALLLTLERTDQTAYYNSDLWSKPTTWVPDGLKYMKHPDKQPAAR